MKRRLELDYTLPEGWLESWLTGLREGRAVATKCSHCGDVQFPPLRACPACRRPTDQWLTISAQATILFRATGTDGDYALAQFEGSDSTTVVKCDALPTGATRGVLRASSEEPPIMQLDPEPIT